MTRRILTLIALFGSIAPSQELRAQESRTAEIEAARDQKTATLAPDTPGKLEFWLIRFKEDKTLERLQAGVGGFTPSFGGLPNGSGLSLGTHYKKTLGFVAVDGTAIASSASWTKFEVGLGSADGRTGPFLFDLRAGRRDYRTIRTPVEDETYRLQDSTIDVLAGVRVHRNVSLGASVGFQSTTAAHLDLDYARAGVFVQADTRDRDRRKGTLLVARFDNYSASANQAYNFRRIDAEAQQYIPLFNGRRVIALRARTVQTFTSNGNSVPLFHQSVLGGSDDLRGFRPFRFRGDNLVLMNAEYRWEVFSGLDMALFGDLGSVSSRRWDFNGLEKSGGIGFRFNARNQTFIRIDTAFSRDGARVYLRFNNIFRDRRLNSSSAAHTL